LPALNDLIERPIVVTLQRLQNGGVIVRGIHHSGGEGVGAIRRSL
jgi:hypothetical protein